MAQRNDDPSAPQAAGAHKEFEAQDTTHNWFLFSQSPFRTTADNQKIPRLTTCGQHVVVDNKDASLVEAKRVDNTQAHHFT